MFNPSKDFSRNTIVKWFVPQKPGLRIKTKQNLEAIIARWCFQSKWNTCVKSDHLPKTTNLWHQQFVKLRIDMVFSNSPTRLKLSQLLSHPFWSKKQGKTCTQSFCVCFYCSFKFPQDLFFKHPTPPAEGFVFFLFYHRGLSPQRLLLDGALDFGGSQVQSKHGDSPDMATSFRQKKNPSKRWKDSPWRFVFCLGKNVEKKSWNVKEGGGTPSILRDIKLVELGILSRHSGRFCFFQPTAGATGEFVFRPFYPRNHFQLPKSFQKT